MNNIIELTNINKYRLDEINKIRDYFNNEIKKRKDIIKKLALYASVVGTPAGIAGSSLTLIFTIGTGISKS